MANRFFSAFKSINYLQLVFDLIIVTIGVYVAVIFSEQKAENDKLKQGQRMIELLEVGITHYQEAFAAFTEYHNRYNVEFRQKLDSNVIMDYSATIYTAPQYPIDVIHYILTNESYEVFTVDFYIPLAAFANNIEQLMYVEEKLVECAEKYQRIPSRSHPDYEIIVNQQLDNAERYYRYLELRKSKSQRMAAMADSILRELEKVGQ